MIIAIRRWAMRRLYERRFADTNENCGRNLAAGGQLRQTSCVRSRRLTLYV